MHSDMLFYVWYEILWSIGILDELCDLVDLTGDSYIFGRGESCDYQFDTSTAIKNPCYQAYSKMHFKITRVSCFVFHFVAFQLHYLPLRVLKTCIPKCSIAH
jgi:hypothetical protein